MVHNDGKKIPGNDPVKGLVRAYEMLMKNEHDKECRSRSYSWGEGLEFRVRGVLGSRYLGNLPYYGPIMEDQMGKKMENEMETGLIEGFKGIRYPSTTVFPFLLRGFLIKADHSEKRYPYFYGVTGEPS